MSDDGARENEGKAFGEKSESDGSDSDSYQSDDSTKEAGLYVISIANLRRREFRHKRTGGEFGNTEGNTEIDLRKKNMDERGVKQANPRKSVCSTEKWLDTGRWKEIVDEGEKSSEMNKGQIRLLHIPSTLPVGPPKPEPLPGFERRKFDPKTGGKIFDELLRIPQ